MVDGIEDESGDEGVVGMEDSSTGAVAVAVLAGIMTIEVAGGDAVDAGADVAAADVAGADDVDLGDPVDDDLARCGGVLWSAFF